MPMKHTDEGKVTKSRIKLQYFFLIEKISAYYNKF